ncbi:hypothetical protein SH528x_004844 [Novipirellula sp. SH528]|uniref:hypothetical protein n=1 Tax=Novipirellula sp. SH528 TaxID=3454466 RepID=UPI003FA15670
MDITCMHCDAVIRIVACGYGVRDERLNFECPECKNALFSSDGSTVYDIVGVVTPAARKTERSTDD